MKLGPKMYECLDVDECNENDQLCSGGKCINSDGSYHCQCPAGFRENGGRCVDVDECEIQNGNRQKFCINTKGESYSRSHCITMTWSWQITVHHNGHFWHWSHRTMKIILAVGVLSMNFAVHCYLSRCFYYYWNQWESMKTNDFRIIQMSLWLWREITCWWIQLSAIQRGGAKEQWSEKETCLWLCSRRLYRWIKM